MNSKNIKKALNRKLDLWLKNVQDETIRKIIKDNTVITGGAIVSLLTGEDVNDYDVYFRTREAVVKVAQYYVHQFNEAHSTSITLEEDEESGKISVFVKSKGVAGETDGVTDETEPKAEERGVVEDKAKPKYRPVYLTSNAITLSDKIQIIIRFYGEVEEIHKNYDFAHCTCAWSSWDNSLILPTKALECIINKELYYIGSKYPLCSIIRTRKFLKRGYTINAGQYLKMCLQLNELDLHNIEVLKDQLTGVDSAYFNMAIEQMSKKQEREPEWKVDNTYLFEVINKIF